MPRARHGDGDAEGPARARIRGADRRRRLPFPEVEVSAMFQRVLLGTSSARNLWMQGILPVLGGLIMYFAGAFA
jgi:hypothetical protein